jgi:group I intron endonuclease
MYDSNIEVSKKQAGIYSITNKVNGKIYIGQSKNISDRMLEHIRDLKSNRHVNWHLQRAFNKYGIENFKFDVIEFCDERELTDK